MLLLLLLDLDENAPAIAPNMLRLIPAWMERERTVSQSIIEQKCGDGNAWRDIPKRLLLPTALALR